MIRLEQVRRTYGGRDAVAGVDLVVERGAFCALIGKSGSGKSTLLRMINRLVEPDSGRVLLNGDDVCSLPPEQLRRQIGYVIQSVGLFPHWSVARNIAAVPVLLGWQRARIQARVVELMALLDLDPALAESAPAALSGGQAQRVGVARALAADPDLLLMDEPFGALDPVTRTTLQTELLRIQRETGKTVVFVTHDMDEALRLASQVVVLEQGRVVQDATPADLLAHPANDLVRDLLGRWDSGLRRLALRTVLAATRPGADAAAPLIRPDSDCRAALSRMAELGVSVLTVQSEDGRHLGLLHLADLIPG
jgi:osmoprotectant transport system ATP-binding protein